VIRRGALALLGAVGAALAIMLLLEILHAPADGSMAMTVAATPAPHAPASSPKPPPDRTAQWVTTLLSRPLFNPDRKPEAAPSAAGTASAAGEPPRLAGIVLSADLRAAIFQPAGKDEKPVVLGEGEAVAGWTVRRIADGAVDVDGIHGARTLSPKFDPTAPAPASATPPNPPVKTVAAQTSASASAQPSAEAAAQPKKAPAANGRPASTRSRAVRGH
jgi:hypothetical protein